ncbi:MAG: CinA family protein [Ruminococcaceae bacterium]|nr:CinA family protein [Oscillospiraceae bacterium]
MEEARLLVEKLIRLHCTISFAESCTGGLLTKLITDVPGASAVLKGGVCAYANEIKHGVLSVTQHNLDTYGAVSRPVALEMARGVKALMHTDIGVGTTGIAGPASDDTKKPVGLVYLGVALPGGRYVSRELHLSGSRDEIREETARRALALVLEMTDHL